MKCNEQKLRLIRINELMREFKKVRCQIMTFQLAIMNI